MINTKQAIIEAGKELFSQKGYTAVRTKEIALRAHINETTLFRYYKSKRELFEQIIIMNVKAIDNENLFHVKVSGVPEEDLVMIAKQLYLLYKSNAQIIRMIMKSIIDDGDSLKEYAAECRGGHIKKYLTQYFMYLKANGTITDDAVLLSELFMNCINGYLFPSLITEDEKASPDHLIKIVRKLTTIIK